MQSRDISKRLREVVPPSLAACLAVACFAMTAEADILITEIMYDPALNNEHEYVELFNNGATAVDLTGYVISDDPSQAFPNPFTLTGGSIDPAGTAVLIRIDHARFLENYQLAWGSDINFIEVPAWPVFTNGGDVVELSDPQGTVVASVNYSVLNNFPFPNDASSIYMLDVNAADLYVPENWALSQVGVDGARLGDSPRTSDIGSPGFVPGVGGLAGDLDGDGFVGISDLNLVLGNWNLNVTAGDPLSGDPSGDGFVGIEDLNEVLGNWNAGTPPAAGAAVPEPATLALLGVSGAAMLRRRRHVPCSC